MPLEKQSALYIFIDESGNFDFSPKGTKYFVLTAVSTLQPHIDRDEFSALRYTLLRNGSNIEFFHATEDKQATRDAVFQVIKNMRNIDVDCVIAEKANVHESLYCETSLQGPQRRVRIDKFEERFYDNISQVLLKHLFERYEESDGIDHIIVVLGSLFTKSKREYVLGSLKHNLKKQFRKPFHIYFHSVQSDINCQIADYCGWATYVKHERGETRPWAEIETKVKSCLEVFK